MHKLILHRFGPIRHCALECSSFMTLTGFQASGKSTIAKAIYYFRTIKEDIAQLAESQALDTFYLDGFEDRPYLDQKTALLEGLENFLREKFLSTFGSLRGMAEEMSIEYHYTKTCFVKIFLNKDEADKKYRGRYSIGITFSDALKEFLQEKNRCFSATPLGVPEEEKKALNRELYQLFDDCCLVVYIPAGRSMITLLSQQFSYIYAKMDDGQRRSMDSCTRDYIERTLRLKSEFSDGLYGLISFFSGKTSLPQPVIHQAVSLIQMILRGDYRYRNGEEQIVLHDGNDVKLNFASSGQQECVWILNLLFYYLLQQKPVLFIIEEPESHLFPESQKYITEWIALVHNCGHSMLVTTHSPYVLGTLNNLLYAYTLPSQYREKASEVINQSLWIDVQQFDSWFVKDGMVESCMDAEIHMIENERIDEISKVINQDFDRLLDLQVTNEDGVVQ